MTKKDLAEIKKFVLSGAKAELKVLESKVQNFDEPYEEVRDQVKELEGFIKGVRELYKHIELNI